MILNAGSKDDVAAGSNGIQAEAVKGDVTGGSRPVSSVGVGSIPGAPGVNNFESFYHQVTFDVKVFLRRRS